MTTIKPAPEPKAEPIKVVGKFAFAIDKGLTIPQQAGRAPSAQELPFKDMFGKMGHNDHIFVPLSFWTTPKAEGGRGVDPEKATVSYQKTKMRGAFNEWRKKDEKERGKWELVLIGRQKGGDSGRFEEDGVSMFLLDSSQS